MERSLWVVVILVSVSWIASHVTREPEGFDVEYTVTPISPTTLRVTAGYRSDRPSMLTVGSIRDDRHCPVTNLTAGSHDRDVQLDRHRELVPATTIHIVPRTRYDIRADEPRVTLSYDVAPSPFRTGGRCATRLAYAVLDSDFVVLPFSSFALAPPDDLVRRVHVRGARDWQCILDDAENANRSRARWADRLFGESLVALSRVEPVALAGAVRLLVSSHYDRRHRGRILALLRQVWSALEHDLGPPPSSLEIIVVADPTKGPYGLGTVPGGALVLSHDASSSGGTRANVADLVERWLGFGHDTLVDPNRRDAWWEVGYAGIVAERATEGLGLIGYGDERLLSLFSAADDVALSDAGMLGRPELRQTPAFRRSFRRKAACAVLLLEWELRIRGLSSLRELWTVSRTMGLRPAVARLAPSLDRAFLLPWIDRYNPMARRFPLIDDAPKPSVRARPPATADLDTLRLIVTGNTDGYLETCGCKLNMSGGVARRATVVSRLRHEHSDALLLDVGGFLPDPELVGEPTDQSRRDLAFYVSELAEADYDAVVLSERELEWSELDRKLLSGADAPFVTTGEAALGDHVPSIRWCEAGDLTVAVIGHASGWPERPWIGSPDSDGVLADAVRSASRSSADLAVLAGDLAIDPPTAWALDPRPDVVLTRRTGATMSPEAERGQYATVRDGTAIVPCVSGVFGVMFVEVYHSRDDGVVGATARVMTLDQTVPADPEVRSRIDEFHRATLPDDSLQDHMLFDWDPDVRSGRYVGVSACEECHVSETEQWRTTGHSRAMQTLVARQRDTHPDCVPCHVTGLGRSGGFRLGSARHPLADVQCETCHGPGAAHVQHPTNANIRLTPTKGVCVECHNPDHSDFFDARYEQAFQRISH